MEYKIIEIDENFKIEVDGIGNHSLVEYTPSINTKNGKDTKVYHGYFSNYANALKKYAFVKTVKTDESLTIKSYIERFENVVNAATEKLIKEIKK